jgi:hypothetical protein
LEDLKTMPYSYWAKLIKRKVKGFTLSIRGAADSADPQTIDVDLRADGPSTFLQMTGTVGEWLVLEYWNAFLDLDFSCLLAARMCLEFARGVFVFQYVLAHFILQHLVILHKQRLLAIPSKRLMPNKISTYQQAGSRLVLVTMLARTRPLSVWDMLWEEHRLVWIPPVNVSRWHKWWVIRT